MSADDQLEADALQCWDLYRAMTLEQVRNPECVPSIEVWTVAYCSGAERGRELEREDCAALASACGLVELAGIIQERQTGDDELGDADEG